MDFWRKIVITFAMMLSLSICAEPNADEEPSTEDLFSETPCELRSLSAYMDAQKNLWGIGDGNIWWFNSTNLSWSLLPLPNGTSSSDPWKVTCGDPRRYVSLQGITKTLILHLPWQHWQQVDTDDVETDSINTDSTWCVSGVLYGTDSTKSSVYKLDHEEARWVKLHDSFSLQNDSVLNEVHNGTKKSWLLQDGRFVLAEQHGNCSHMLIANLSGGGWNLLKKRDTEDSWPNLQDQLLTWAEADDLWLWSVSDKNSEHIWNFNFTEQRWKCYRNSSTNSIFPDIKDILTTWIEEEKICFLVRTEKCTAQYSSSTSKCISNQDMRQSFSTHSPSLTAPMTTPTSVNDTTAAGTNIPPPQSSSTTGSTPRAIFIAAHTVINKHSLLSALQSELDHPEADEEMPITAAIPAKHNPWHQHTSVFGSVIFFGTSLSIFGLVGSIWCMRKCVYFPKEALLLRDPPSVRYTAIPDNVPFDPRSHPATAYTVIPDSIA